MSSLYGSIVNHSPRSLFDISRVVSNTAILGAESTLLYDDGVPMWGYVLVYYGEEGEGLYETNLNIDNERWKAAEGHLVNFNRTIWQKRPKYYFYAGESTYGCKYYAVARLDSVLPYLNTTELKGYENKVTYLRLNAIPLEILRDMEYTEVGYKDISDETASGIIAFDTTQMENFNERYAEATPEIDKIYSSLYEATQDIDSIEDNGYILIDYNPTVEINTLTLGEEYMIAPVAAYTYQSNRFFLEEPQTQNGNHSAKVLKEESSTGDIYGKTNDYQEITLKKYKFYEVWDMPLDSSSGEPLNWKGKKLVSYFMPKGKQYVSGKYYIFNEATGEYELDEREEFDPSSTYYMIPTISDYATLIDFYESEDISFQIMNSNRQRDLYHFGNNDGRLFINYHLIIFLKLTKEEDGKIISYLTPVGLNRLKMENIEQKILTIDITPDQLKDYKIDNVASYNIPMVYDKLIASNTESTSIDNFSNLDSLAFLEEIENNISNADANIITARQNLVVTQEQIKEDTDTLLVNLARIVELSGYINEANKTILENIGYIEQNQKNRKEKLDKIKEYNDDIAEQSGKISTNTGLITQELGTLSTTISDLTKTKNSLNSETNSIKSNNDTINTAISTITSIINDEIKPQLTAINNNKTTLTTEISTVNKYLSNYISLVNTANERISTAVSNSNSAVSTLSSAITTIDTNLSYISSAVSTISNLDTTAADYATSLETACSTILSSNTAIDDQTDTINSVITSLKTVASLSTVTITEYSYTSQIPANLESIYDTILTSINDILTQVNNNIIPSINTITTSAGTTIPNLITAMEKQISEVLGSHDNISKYNGYIIEYNSYIATDSGYISTLKGELDTLYSDLNEYKNNINTLNTNIIIYNTDINTLENTNIDLTNNVLLYLDINVKLTEFLNAVTDEYAMYTQMLEWYRWVYLPLIEQLETKDANSSLYAHNTRTLEYPTK